MVLGRELYKLQHYEKNSTFTIPMLLNDEHYEALFIGIGQLIIFIKNDAKIKCNQMY